MMEIKCRLLIVTFVCLCFTLQQASAAIWHGKGCNGHKAGEKWFVEYCAVCHCSGDDQFTCYTCGAIILAPKKGCYVDYENRSSHYPMCCGKRYFCRGDPGFDSKKFDDYWKNDIVG